MKRGNIGRVDAMYWNRLLQVMRITPGNISNAAREMKSDHKTVKRLWEVGEPSAPWGKRPMKAVIAEEQGIARASRAERSVVEERAAVMATVGSASVATVVQAQHARSDAVATRSEEGKLVKAARANAIALLQVIASVSQGALKLGERVRDSLKDRKKLDDITLPTAMLLLVRYQRLVASGVASADAVAELERRVLGDPNDRAGDESVLDADDMSEEEALEELTKAAEVARRRVELGLRVVAGGAGAGAGDSRNDAAGHGASVVDAAPAPARATTAPRGLMLNDEGGSLNGGAPSVNDPPSSVNGAPDDDPDE